MRWLALFGGAPAVATALWCLYQSSYSAKVCWTLSLLILIVWFSGAELVREGVLRAVQTLGNLLLALREGDYSLRARNPNKEDDLGLALWAANDLGQTLLKERTSALEAGALLNKVMEEIDVAVFAFGGSSLRLINRAGEQLLGKGHGELGSRLSECMEGPSVRTMQLPSGPFEVRRSHFRLDGKPHVLLVLSDLRRALRQEERQSFQRLVRVLGHEINNSLAPIQSISDSLLKIADKGDPGAADDLRAGLLVIGRRAESLGRFLQAYTRWARLPPPKFKALSVRGWISQVVGLEDRFPVTMLPGPEVSILGDPDQLEQLLINLIHNAVDAVFGSHKQPQALSVTVSHKQEGAFLEVVVDDMGPGLPDTANLFVPFFTTKPHGSGIGLVISRQIAEAHGGDLELRNRPSGNGSGCSALLRLPLRI